jgi:hypothetical protein
MTAQQRDNPMANELFRLVEGHAGYAHISDGIGNLTDEHILNLAEAAGNKHTECAKLLNDFVYHHAKRIALKRAYAPMKRRAAGEGCNS